MLQFFENSSRWTDIHRPFSKDVKITIPADEGFIGKIEKVLILLCAHFNKIYVYQFYYYYSAIISQDQKYFLSQSDDLPILYQIFYPHYLNQCSTYDPDQLYPCQHQQYMLVRIFTFQKPLLKLTFMTSLYLCCFNHFHRFVYLFLCLEEVIIIQAFINDSSRKLTINRKQNNFFIIISKSQDSVVSVKVDGKEGVDVDFFKMIITSGLVLFSEDLNILRFFCALRNSQLTNICQKVSVHFQRQVFVFGRVPLEYFFIFTLNKKRKGFLNLQLRGCFQLFLFLNNPWTNFINILIKLTIFKAILKILFIFFTSSLFINVYIFSFHFLFLFLYSHIQNIFNMVLRIYLLLRVQTSRLESQVFICEGGKELNEEKSYYEYPIHQIINYLFQCYTRLQNIYFILSMQNTLEESANNIPLLTIHAGPKDPKWNDRLKEQIKALILYVKSNKENDNDWFKIEPKQGGKYWSGICNYTHNLVRYEFKIQFQIPATYPSSPIEIQIPELEGKTIKMYRGGKICQDIHFAPLWAKNTPKLGIAHALAMALGPWLAAQVPNMVKEEKLVPK